MSASPGGRASEGAAGPVLRVVKGEPSPRELAALVAVVAALETGSASAPDRPVAPSGWVRAARQAGLRRGLRAGPGAWRDPARPGSC